MSDSELTIEWYGDEASPGGELAGRIIVNSPAAARARAINISVFWHTEGKGDEDKAIQHTENRTANDAVLFDSNGAAEFSISLPTAPLSYEGMIVKIVWNMQVRVFLNDGMKLEDVVTFRLGQVASVAAREER